MMRFTVLLVTIREKSGLTLTLNDYKMGKQTLRIWHQMLQDF